MWRRDTKYKHIVLREDGEAVIGRISLEILMPGRVSECLRNSLEEFMRLHPGHTESEILSDLAYLADHPAEVGGYAGMEVAVRSEVPFPLDYDFVERYRAAEGLELLEVYQDDAEDDFYAV